MHGSAQIRTIMWLFAWNVPSVQHFAKCLNFCFNWQPYGVLQALSWEQWENGWIKYHVYGLYKELTIETTFTFIQDLGEWPYILSSFLWVYYLIVAIFLAIEFIEIANSLFSENFQFAYGKQNKSLKGLTDVLGISLNFFCIALVSLTHIILIHDH